METPTGRKRPHSEMNEFCYSFDPSPTTPSTAATGTEQASGALQGAIHHGDGWTAKTNSTAMRSVVGRGIDDPFQSTSTSTSSHGCGSQLNHVNPVESMSSFESPAPAPARPQPDNAFTDADAEEFIRLITAAMAEDPTLNGDLDSDLSGDFGDSNPTGQINDQVAANGNDGQDSNSSSNAVVDSDASSAPGTIDSNFSSSSIPDNVNSSPPSGSVPIPNPTNNIFQRPSQTAAFETLNNAVNLPFQLETIDSQLETATRDGATPTKQPRRSKAGPSAHISGIPPSSPSVQASASATHPSSVKTLGSPFHPASAPSRLQRDVQTPIDLFETPPTTARNPCTRLMNGVEVSPTPVAVGRRASCQPAPRARPNSNRAIPLNAGQHRSPAHSVTATTGPKSLRNGDPTSPTLPPAKRARTTTLSSENIVVKIAASQNQNRRIYSVVPQYNLAELTSHFNQADIPSDHKWLTRMYGDPEPPPSKMAQMTGYEFPIPLVTGMLAPSVTLASLVAKSTNVNHQFRGRLTQLFNVKAQVKFRCRLAVSLSLMAIMSCGIRLRLLHSHSAKGPCNVNLIFRLQVRDPSRARTMLRSKVILQRKAKPTLSHQVMVQCNGQTTPSARLTV
ncbi:hypothetical protein A1O3_10288 [Capronia epimyces CBS 606.96]|uniref:Uncharacterized protein n=1 Tax=Capronia epimyces CBS 606.96 TaxID=1182542 RepID=W9XIF1_9EURO|nr:uncharacterized protein A1O3_10288 [Capronia epimyces CBS 606.96]EXJ77130.1 hypothetical protein A1O3_10288 [Capronia epimyces CBS 606.96]